MDPRFAIGLLGSILLIIGVATRSPRSKDALFAAGNACMFLYALLGYLGGGPVFFLILQIFIAISTVSMLFKIPDRYDTLLLAISGLGLALWSLSLFDGYSTALFVAGLALLGIGFAMDTGTKKREIALALGSVVIAAFSFLMRDWIFMGLNALFAVLSLANLVRMRRQTMR